MDGFCNLQYKYRYPSTYSWRIFPSVLQLIVFILLFIKVECGPCFTCQSIVTAVFTPQHSLCIVLRTSYMRTASWGGVPRSPSPAFWQGWMLFRGINPRGEMVQGKVVSHPLSIALTLTPWVAFSRGITWVLRGVTAHFTLAVPPSFAYPRSHQSAVSGCRWWEITEPLWRSVSLCRLLWAQCCNLLFVPGNWHGCCVSFGWCAVSADGFTRRLTVFWLAYPAESFSSLMAIVAVPPYFIYCSIACSSWLLVSFTSSVLLVFCWLWVIHLYLKLK